MENGKLCFYSIGTRFITCYLQDVSLAMQFCWLPERKVIWIAVTFRRPSFAISIGNMIERLVGFIDQWLDCSQQSKAHFIDIFKATILIMLEKLDWARLKLQYFWIYPIKITIFLNFYWFLCTAMTKDRALQIPRNGNSYSSLACMPIQSFAPTQ